MRYSRAYINRNEGKFDSFCKTVLRNKARDWMRRKERRKEQEILFTDTVLALHPEASHTDYIICNEFQEISEFGRTFWIKSDTLAKELQMLSPRERKIILLFYFLGWTDQKVGIRLHVARSTIQKARMKTLQEMRKSIERQKQSETGNRA